MCGRSRNSGFTIIELMVTLVVLAVILAIGVPSFRTLIENNRVTAQANTLLSAVNLARTEAIKRGSSVSLIAEVGGFEKGYCVAVGAHASCTAAETANAVVRTFADPGRITINDNGITSVTFDGRGFRSSPGVGATVEIDLQPEACVTGAMRLRQLDVSLAGRASIMEGACS